VSYLQHKNRYSRLIFFHSFAVRVLSFILHILSIMSFPTVEYCGNFEMRVVGFPLFDLIIQTQGLLLTVLTIRNSLTWASVHGRYSSCKMKPGVPDRQSLRECRELDLLDWYGYSIGWAARVDNKQKSKWRILECSREKK
jgi:hypothetical protein